MNCELPDVQDEFRKCRGTRDQLPASIGSSKKQGKKKIKKIKLNLKKKEKARKFQKNIYFCFTDYTKAFDCVDHDKLWKILKDIGIPDHLTCLLRNLYAG